MKSNLILIIGIISCSFIGSAYAVSTQLTLVKEVIGGEATVTDWVLTADGTDANDLSAAGWVSGYVAPDTFNLSESAGSPGYTAGDWDCVGGGTLVGQSLTLSEGDVVTCTIINTYVPPVVVFDTDFALPAMPDGDGSGTPVCVDVVSGLLIAGCDAAYNTNLTESQVDAFVDNNGYSIGPHTIDTHLTEAQVDTYVSNNGYGDITGVTTAVGSGLIGGSSSGSVALSVSEVTSAMIANETITGSDINTDTTVTAADFVYSSVRTGYTLLSALTCVQHNSSTGTLDRDIYFRSPGGGDSTNSHGPFVHLRTASAAGTYHAVCRANIQVPPTSTLAITAATFLYSDPSPSCLVGGTLRAKQLPSSYSTILASVYSGTSASDVSTFPGWNQTKAFPAFSAYTLTQTATAAGEVFFEVEFEQTEAGQDCRFIGVQLTYTVSKP